MTADAAQDAAPAALASPTGFSLIPLGDASAACEGDACTIL